MRAYPLSTATLLYHKKNGSLPNETDLDDVIALVNGPFRERRRGVDTGELSDEDQETFDEAATSHANIQEGLSAWFSGKDASSDSVSALKEMIDRSALKETHELRDLECMDDIRGKSLLEKLSKIMKVDKVFKVRNTVPAPTQTNAALKVRPRRVRLCTVACSS